MQLKVRWIYRDPGRGEPSIDSNHWLYQSHAANRVWSYFADDFNAATSWALGYSSTPQRSIEWNQKERKKIDVIGIDATSRYTTSIHKIGLKTWKNSKFSARNSFTKTEKSLSQMQWLEMKRRHAWMILFTHELRKLLLRETLISEQSS